MNYVTILQNKASVAEIEHGPHGVAQAGMDLIIWGTRAQDPVIIPYDLHPNTVILHWIWLKHD